MSTSSEGLLSAIRGVLFDKDGTLFEFRGTWTQTHRECARETARWAVDAVSSGTTSIGEEQADDAELAKLADRLLISAGYDPDSDYYAADGLLAAGNADQIAERWTQELIAAGVWPPLSEEEKGERAQRMAMRFAELYADQGPELAVPACELRMLFERLDAAGLVVGVATSDSERAARRALERFSLAELVAFVCGYDSGSGHKPEPGMVWTFADRNGLAPYEIAVVGDTPYDLEMARRAGAGAAIAVLTGAGARDELERSADLVLPDVCELVHVLGLEAVGL